MSVKVRGTRIYIGTTAANGLTDTYIEIKDAKMLQTALGIQWETTDDTKLVDTFRQNVKTVASAGDMELSGSYDKTDPGQAALKAAAEATDAGSDTPYNIRINQPDNTLIYVKARVMSFRTSHGNVTNLLEFRSQCSVTALPVAA